MWKKQKHKEREKRIPQDKDNHHDVVVVVNTPAKLDLVHTMTVQALHEHVDVARYIGRLVLLAQIRTKRCMNLIRKLSQDCDTRGDGSQPVP